MTDRTTLRRIAGLAAGLLVFGSACAATVSADPGDYPQFAQQEVARDIAIKFTSVDELKARLDTGVPLRIIDVRGYGNYARGHLPGAVSIPLGILPYSLDDIPKDIPVVLY
jgi:hypothetical protein